MNRLIGFLLVLSCFASTGLPREASAEDPPTTFSFWRNLPETPPLLGYMTTPQPLEDDAIAEVGPVRPERAVTLVRNGRVVAHGRIDRIYAALVPRAGDDRMLYFTISGLPDSVGVSNGPPRFPDSNDNVYDLYIIGDARVEEYDPVPATRSALEDTLAPSGKDATRTRRTIDYFVKIDGVPHAVLRDVGRNSGLWAYLVYRLETGRAPKLVHADGSWST